MSDEIAVAPRRSLARRLAGAYAHPGALGAFGLVLLGTALFLLSWPPGPLPWLVFVADAPFLWLLFRDPRRWKRWIFLYAALHYAAGFWWLSQITWIQVFFASVFMTPIYLVAGGLIRWSVRRRLPWLLVVPMVLVLEEMTRTVYMGGMPLPMRSLALSTVEAYTASCAYLGAYGLSFLAAMGGSAAARWPFHARRGAWPRVLVDGAVVVVVGGLFFGAGAQRLESADERLVSSAPAVMVAVQGNVPQSLKHSPEDHAAQKIFQRHLDLSALGIETATAAGLEVVVVLWPETMVPWELVDADLAARFPEAWENEVRILQNVQASVPPVGLTRTPRFLLGAIYQFRRGDERHLDWRRYGTHDSLFFVDPDEVPSAEGPYPRPPAPGGRPSWEIGRHDKRVLVPGGEYTPLGGLLPPLRWIRNLLSVIPELDPGAEDQEPFVLRWDANGGGIRLGTAVCFELLSPAPCRAWREAGATVLLNPSNYGWFGETAFRAQIRAVCRLRAAETACCVVVAGNTGPTLFYDPLGRPYGTFEPEAAPGMDVGSDANTFRDGVAIGALITDGETTPYVRWGDLPWIGLALILLGFGLFTPRPRDAPVT